MAVHLVYYRQQETRFLPEEDILWGAQLFKSTLDSEGWLYQALLEKQSTGLKSNLKPLDLVWYY